MSEVRLLKPRRDSDESGRDCWHCSTNCKVASAALCHRGRSAAQWGYDWGRRRLMNGCRACESTT